MCMCIPNYMAFMCRIISASNLMTDQNCYHIACLSQKDLKKNTVDSRYLEIGPSKTLRDIRTSTYQICSIEGKTVRTTKFHI